MVRRLKLDYIVKTNNMIVLITLKKKKVSVL